MAASTFQRFTLLLFSFAFFVAVYAPRIRGRVDEVSGLKIVTELREWPLSMSMYSDLDGSDDDDNDDGIDDGSSDSDEGGLVYLVGQEEGEKNRRSLFWRRVHYYISYGSLSANRIPCPPLSGRSYYTHNCFKKRTPVNPYTRGCSMISRCRR